MNRRIVLLNAPIVPAAQKTPGSIEQSGADRDAAFRQTKARFFDCHL